MRTFAVSLALIIGSVAFASFDLMLLGDNTTAGSQRIMRYDPVNKVVLGSFGTGFIDSDVRSIAVDQVGGRAFVQQINGLTKVFNYNTGALLDAFSTPYGDIEYDAGLNRLTGANGQGSGTSPARAYDGTSLGVVASFVDRWYSTAALRRPGANWYASFGLTSDASTVIAVQNSLAGGSPIGEVLGNAWVNFNAPRAAIFTSGNRLMGISSDSVANTTSLWTVDTNTSGFVGGVGVSGSMGAYALNANIANGHGNLVYMLIGTNLVSYHSGLSSVMGTQSLSFSSNIRGMAVVIAPEPGTMLALAGGIAALLRRRKSPSKKIGKGF